MDVKLKYMPILQEDLKLKKRGGYEAQGGLPGVAWGELYNKYITTGNDDEPIIGSGSNANGIAGDDFEFCCVVTHDSAGCTCAIYRSLEKCLIYASFRGTCQPIDLVTDASIAQTRLWRNQRL